MGGFIHDLQWYFNFFSDLFLQANNQRGSITLSYGYQEIEIDLDVSPKRISLSVQEPPDVVPVCAGGVNLVGAKLLPQGFVLYADIQTTVAQVNWIVEYGINPFPDDPGHLADKSPGVVQ